MFYAGSTTTNPLENCVIVVSKYPHIYENQEISLPEFCLRAQPIQIDLTSCRFPGKLILLSGNPQRISENFPISLTPFFVA